MLSMVCNDVEIEPVLQELTGESLPSGANRSPDARLDIHARGFWERQRSAFFDVRVCYPNADSYRDLDLKQIYIQEERKQQEIVYTKSDGRGTGNIYTISLHNNSWHGRRVKEIP